MTDWWTANLKIDVSRISKQIILRVYDRNDINLLIETCDDYWALHDVEYI